MNAWAQFTERARRLVFFAQEEAGLLGEHYVSTEHLLLGLVRENDSVGCRILERMGVSAERVRYEIEKHVAKGDGQRGQEMQLTPRSKRVIDFAYEEAKQLGNKYIGTEHFLLGLIREGEGLAGRVLATLGIDLEQARKEAKQLYIKDNTGKTIAKEAMAREEKRTLYSLGDLGILITIITTKETYSKVEFAETLEVFFLIQNTYETKDVFGYKELMSQGSLRLISALTSVKILQHHDSGVQKLLLVRLLEGDHAGEKGWVRLTNFQYTGQDESEFPPPI